MLTLEHINKGADFYDKEASRAQAQAEYHRGLGSIHTDTWAEMAVKYQDIAEQLRSLVK